MIIMILSLVLCIGILIMIYVCCVVAHNADEKEYVEYINKTIK